MLPGKALVIWKCFVRITGKSEESLLCGSIRISAKQFLVHIMQNVAQVCEEAHGVQIARVEVSICWCFVEKRNGGSLVVVVLTMGKGIYFCALCCVYINTNWVRHTYAIQTFQFIEIAGEWEIN